MMTVEIPRGEFDRFCKEGIQYRFDVRLMSNRRKMIEDVKEVINANKP